MTHPAMSPGKIAVVTGAANGIGLASVKRYVSFGMKVCMADIDQSALEAAVSEVSAVAIGGDNDVMAVLTDVGKREDIEALKEAVLGRFGEVSVLMNNAASRVVSGALGEFNDWQTSINANLWSVINGCQIFIPSMIKQDYPSVIINTSSKQGITLPPANMAYNVGKAAVKAYTELLQHELRNISCCPVTAHMLVPGWTTRGGFEPKVGQWSPDQVVDIMIPAIERGDFYIIVQDDEVSREEDQKRILWAAGDIAFNRPPLSRWHGGFSAEFDSFSV